MVKGKLNIPKPALPYALCAMRSALCALLLAIALLTLPLAAHSQTRTTLFGWEDQTKMMILDRYHNYGGAFYDRGLFRFTTPSMTKEHDLDLITYTFTPADEYLWHVQPGNSFRTYMGSFNLGEFIQGIETRNNIPAGERLTIPLHINRRYDMRQDRMLVRLGLDYELDGSHRIGLSHTLTEQKPDLDATFWYRYGEWESGAVQAEFTALDWANNAAYNLGQKRGTDDPQMRKYEVRPYLFSVKAATPVWNNLRGELIAGIQTPLQTAGEFIPGSDERYRDRSRNRYLGVQAEYADERFTFGLSWTHRYASFSRRNAEEPFDEPADYGNKQIENSLGAFLAVNYNNFYLHNWVWRNYNVDRQFDDIKVIYRTSMKVYPFDFHENRWFMRNRLGYDPGERGFMAAVEWSADYRHFLGDDYEYAGTISKAVPYRGFYRFAISSYNERLTFMFGYRFSPRIYFNIGASYDVDGDFEGGWTTAEVRDHPQRFDGGFGRLVLYW